MSIIVVGISTLVAQDAMQKADTSGWIAPVASIAGVVITALVAVSTAFWAQAGTRQSERNARFTEAIQMLGDPTPSKRATGVSILAEMALPGGKRDAEYFRSAVEALCLYVRFDRDMYCRDAVFNAIKRLKAQDEPAVQTLRSNLREDLLRQIGEFAAANGLNLENAEHNLLEAAPEAAKVLAAVFSDEHAELESQLASARAFPPAEDSMFLVWSVRLTGRDLARTWV